MYDIYYLRNEFEKACENNVYVTTLFDYATKCCHVTEFNSTCDPSTIVFLYNRNIIRSYNTIVDNEVKNIVNELIENDWDLVYKKGTILEEEIEETDLLYINSVDSYYNLIRALKKYENKVTKYIAISKTHKYAIKGKHNENGLLPAIIKFIMLHNNWKISFYDIICNGMTILEKHN
jgi:hypothetical protein